MLAGFFVMGFSDIIGTVMNQVKAECKLSDVTAGFLPSMIFKPLTGAVRRSPAKLNTDVLLSSSVMLLIAVSEELLAFISSSAVMKRCLQPVAV